MRKKSKDVMDQDYDDFDLEMDEIELDGQPLRSAMALDIFLSFMSILAWVWLALMVVGLCIALYTTMIGIIPGFEKLADIPDNVITVWTGVKVIGAIIAILVLQELRKISKTLLRGDPFVPRNASRLRRIWMTVAIGEAVRTALMFIVMLHVWKLDDLNFANSWFGNITGLNSGSKVIPLRWEVWSMVLILIVLAQVFRQGAAMREQEKLTV